MAAADGSKPDPADPDASTSDASTSDAATPDAMTSDVSVPGTEGYPDAADDPDDEPLAGFSLWLRIAILAFDGFLVALFAVFFLPEWIGSVPFPISGLVAGVINIGLGVLAASIVGARYAGVPLLGFAAGLLLCMLGGPGGDVLVPADWRLFVLFGGGLIPPLVVLFMRRLRPGADTGSQRTDVAG